MAGEARHHHYISQAYLRGFSKSGAKNSRIETLDLSRGNHFTSSVRNVGGQRDFNRINLDDFEPNYIEQQLSAFESKIRPFVATLEDRGSLKGDTRYTAINLVALYAIRNPAFRENMNLNLAELYRSLAEFSIATEERWKSICSGMKKAGYDSIDSVPYEDLKDFVDRGEYDVLVKREFNIALELKLVEGILPYLNSRSWGILHADISSGNAGFVTCDFPVCLNWIDAERVPVLLRQSPGFANRNTTIVFPVSRKVCLFGDFSGKEKVKDAPLDYVARLNSVIILNAHKQVWASKLGFVYSEDGKGILTGSDLLKKLELKDNPEN